MEFLVFIGNSRNNIGFFLRVRGVIIEVIATLVEYNIWLPENVCHSLMKILNHRDTEYTEKTAGIVGGSKGDISNIKETLCLCG